MSNIRVTFFRVSFHHIFYLTLTKNLKALVKYLHKIAIFQFCFINQYVTTNWSH